MVAAFAYVLQGTAAAYLSKPGLRPHPTETSIVWQEWHSSLRKIPPMFLVRTDRESHNNDRFLANPDGSKAEPLKKAPFSLHHIDG